MKIKKLKIKNYKGIEDIMLDFTYPVGHEKQGQAFDKICIIGQSGTGKTQILYLIMQLSIIGSRSTSLPDNFPSESIIEVEFEIKVAGLIMVVKKVIKNNKLSYTSVHSVDQDISTLAAKALIDSVADYSKKIHTYFFSAQADYLTARKYYGDILGSNNGNAKKSSEFYDLHFNQCIFSYQDTINVAFSAYIEKINNYELFERDMRVNASHYAEQGGDIIEYINEWKLTNANPKELFASEYLTDILDAINVGVELDFSEDEGNIVFKNKKSSDYMDLEQLSSGARKLISMALPLLIHEPKSSLILIDEPESSLYPSMQLKIIPFFTQIGFDNQIILATHSPIVSSFFEPWEIIELKFDEVGNMYQEKNLPVGAKRAVKNYIVDPRYLTWTSILTRLFDLNQDSNEAVRMPILMKMASLRNSIIKLRKLPEKEQDLKKISAEYLKLAKLVDWNTESFDI